MPLTSDGTAYEIAYGVVLTVHIASALASFGMLALSGLYGAWGQHVETPKDLRDLRQFFGPPNRIGRSLWAVPVAGGVALWLNHGAGALGQAWVVAATVCWAVATVVAVTVIWPSEARIRPVVLRLEQTPFTASGLAGREELAAVCRPVVRAAAFCDIIFTVALALMVLKPGS